MQTELLINGKLAAGEGEVEEVLDPATGKVPAHGGLKRSGYGKDLSMRKGVCLESECTQSTQSCRV